jgi:hypothetical protein
MPTKEIVVSGSDDCPQPEPQNEVDRRRLRDVRFCTLDSSKRWHARSMSELIMTVENEGCEADLERVDYFWTGKVFR